jgi:hypothetical protein
VRGVEQLLGKNGWPRVPLALRPRGRLTVVSLTELVILAADVRPHQTIVSLIDLNGRFLARQVDPLLFTGARAIAG